jgi:hypothetical protein
VPTPACTARADACDDGACGTPLDAADVDKPPPLSGRQQQRAVTRKRHVETHDEEATFMADFDLEPFPRPTAAVRRVLTLCHEALVTVLLDLSPCVQPVPVDAAGGCSITAVTVYVTPFVLIGALVVLGVLVGVGLVLLTVTRERRDARAAGDEAAEATDRDRAA